jgi:hypothetical protein
MKHMMVSHTPLFVTFDGTQHELDTLAALLTEQSIVFERTDEGINVDLRVQEGDTALQKGAFVLELVDLYTEDT